MVQADREGLPRQGACVQRSWHVGKNEYFGVTGTEGSCGEENRLEQKKGIHLWWEPQLPHKALWTLSQGKQGVMGDLIR